MNRSYFIGFDGATNALVATVAAVEEDASFSAEEVMDDGRIYTERPSHSAQLVPLLNNLCDGYLKTNEGLHAALKQKPDFIACGNGPGSFTGLRIAVTTAKTLGQGLGVPVFAFSSLDFFLWCLTDAGSLSTSDAVVMLDAKKKRCYTAHRFEGRLVESDEPPAEFLEKTGRPLTILTNNKDAVEAYIHGRRPGKDRPQNDGPGPSEYPPGSAAGLWQKSRVFDFSAKEAGMEIVSGRRLALFIRSRIAELTDQERAALTVYNQADLFRLKPNYMRMPEVRYPDPK